MVGDRVLFEAVSETEGLLLERNSRRSSFARWNVKRFLNQTICANMDQILCVCSIDSPPFRPRFVDRVVACAQGVDVVVCMNKCDMMLTRVEEERFRLYGRLGFRTVRVSAKTGENVDTLRGLLQGRTTAVIGQSGVGKSSLVNAVLGTSQKTGEVSGKYNRGRHTTNHAIMLESASWPSEGFRLIDTPGFREISPPHDDILRVRSAFPEFESCKCPYESCLHIDEEDCLVKRAVEMGEINSDRYYSYVSMVEDMQSRSPAYLRSGKRK